MSAGVVLTRIPDRYLTDCRRCRGRVIWAITAGGARLALDPDPDPAGNQAVSRDVHGTVRTRQLRAGEQPEAYERPMVPHRPECERRQADAHAAAGQLAGVVDLATFRRRRRAGQHRGGTK